jgi:hypothetical protein
MAQFPAAHQSAPFKRLYIPSAVRIGPLESAIQPDDIGDLYIWAQRIPKGTSGLETGRRATRRIEMGFGCILHNKAFFG